MVSSGQHLFGQFLKHTAAALDISAELYRRAVGQYEEVGEWLDAPDSPLRRFLPRIYPHGSFRLGTVTRPLTDEDYCDIDLVCWLQLLKTGVTQRDLKNMVGDRLKSHREYKHIIEECRTCWTLEFDKHFRMDILPAIPNLEQSPDGILITDKELTRWRPSNPIGFSAWFMDRMKAERDRLLILANKANVEEVPEWEIKTPLQRAVQLLKRHRDLRYEIDPEFKPISIIITTLAAKAYKNEIDLFSAMERIVHTMRDHVEVRDGIYWVENPVNRGENFALDWNTEPQRREVFYEWLDVLEKDFDGALAQTGLHKVKMVLANSFGRGPVERAFNEIGRNTLLDKVSGNLSVTPVTGIIASTAGIPISPHRFYGDATH